ncbi:unnamed protein product [Parascedosporium putredinis]|uniref:JmjC domain-containing protein n=1 Tax=Parascedosporium putredinis TaxID=1442378 RepID=A0A9P1MF35_9PEZI|nr:unnamed protein product [Parascedosporium putredinis]CAI8004157.1 unnamed protein product [Parascedosporium putredinis]
MPTSMHPQAKFDPIPPDLDLHELVENTPNLSWVVRITTAQIRNLSQQEFENLVNIHVVQQGRPLVISGWDEVLPKNLFGSEWLERTYDKRPYPPNVFYMNENVTDKGDDEASTARGGDLFRTQVEAAPAGDLMSCLPEKMRAENLMCYIGHEGTYTPAHREMCASLGQNLMVEASIDDGEEKAGSSIWFMTETKDREVVREYFLSMLGHDIEIEKHFAQINAWKKATFPVYVVEQKAGDFILVPPCCPPSLEPWHAHYEGSLEPNDG